MYGKHVQTATTYPKDSATPSSSKFTNLTLSHPSGDRTRTEYAGDSTSPHGGHHAGTDKVKVISAEAGGGSPSKATYPNKMHDTFKNEKVM